MKEVIVLGGGAAGIFCALFAADKNIHVTVIEKNKEPLKKLLLTGNGKCNFWNQDQDLKHFHSQERDSLKEIFSSSNTEEVYQKILSMGVVPFCKDHYVYPYSMQSFTMKHAFLEECKNHPIDFVCDTEVLSVHKKQDVFEVDTSKGKYKGDFVVITTGSKAYPKTGSDGKGYEIASSFCHTIVEVEPSLVSLEMEDGFLKDWAGIRSHVQVSYLDKKEEGEIQLTKNGISGICVFNLSREVARDLTLRKQPVVMIHFLPFVQSVSSFLEEQNRKVKNRDIGTLLEAILNYKLVDVILKQCHISREAFYHELPESSKQKLCEFLSSFPCKIIGTGGFENGQVCSGGISLSEMDVSTMESKKEKGLFFAGEVLDIDGDCGGYNLETAFVTGMLAGKGIKKFLS